MTRTKTAALLAILLVLALLVAGCSGTPAASSGAADSSAAGSQAAEASSAPSAAETASADDSAAGKTFKVGFAQKTLDNPYFKALATAIETECKAKGWEVTVLDGKNTIDGEIKNIETFVAQKMDLIFLDTVDPSACVAAVNAADAAGIPVIGVDSGIDEGANAVTVVYSDNLQNGKKVGNYIVETMGDTPIESVLISGAKGNPVGKERRTGLFCGILEKRLGLTEEEAWKQAEEFDQQLTDNGKATNEQAKFSVLGQGWGGWTAEEGLSQTEDLLTANPNINVLLGENDDMLIGGMTAIENAGKTGNISIFAAADGQKEALKLIQDGTAYKATGENSPTKIAALAVKIANEILVEGKDPKSYEAVTKTEANCINASNVADFYDPDSLF